jgi:hypothetical protein
LKHVSVKGDTSPSAGNKQTSSCQLFCFSFLTPET